jgi:hypothetical protein
MAHSSAICLLGLLLLASSASAATVGPIKDRPVAGRPLGLNIPFALDEPGDRACASATVRYGSAPVPRTTVHVQGHGVKRNLLVTSRANVNDQPVTLNVRVGCGAKSVERRFVMLTDFPVAKKPPTTEPASRQVASPVALKTAHKPLVLMTPSEPLFPPPAEQPLAAENNAPKADSSLLEDLRKARAEAASALAQFEAARKELAAVLDVERRTSQTLISADHQVRDARSEVAHMRLVLKWIAAALALAAAGVGWFEFNRVVLRRRMANAQPAQEPTILSGIEAAAS